MHSSILMLALAGAATTFAAAVPAPAALEERQAYVPCAGLEGTAQCCAVDVLGVADLNCANPTQTPTSAADFTAICAAIGQEARCCTLPILGQALICQNPTGTV